MKKLLALVLALVMTLSLCTISNAAYSDQSDVDYDEAVAVMSLVGVFQGADGKFSPKAELTREQAAKLIAYLDLGEKTAEALPAVKVFNDVEANRWSAKYVAYCADAGYLAGVGDNNFDPAGKLTGYAFGKMLLCVLGYDAAIEGFTGANWQIAVAKLMQSNDIAKSVDAPSSATLTREAAAQYCLNTLKATMVEYTSKGTQITINGAVIATGASKAETVENKAEGQLFEGKTLQLAEKLYAGKLTVNAKGTDDFGRVGNVWTYTASGKTTKTDVFAATADKVVVITDATKQGKLLDAYKELVDKKTTAKAITLTAINGETEEIKDELKVGDIVEYTLTDGVPASALVIRYSFGQLSTKDTKATSKKGAFTTYTVATGVSGVVYTTVVDEDKDVDTVVLEDNVAKDDYVLYLKAGDNLYIKAAKTVSGKVAAIKGIKGEKYSIDGTYYATVEGKLAIGDEGTWALNAEGKIAGTVDTVTKSSDYAYVYNVITVDAAADEDGEEGKNAKVYMILADGTKASYIVDEDSTKITKGSVIAYVINKDGYIENATASETIMNEAAKAEVSKSDAGVVEGIYANGDTKFVFVKNTEENATKKVAAEVVTGYKNVVINQNVIAVSKDSVAKLVFVIGTNGAAKSDVTYAVMVDSTQEYTKDVDKNEFCTVKIAVDGEEKDLTVSKKTVGKLNGIKDGDVFSYTMTGSDIDVTPLEYEATKVTVAEEDYFVAGKQYALSDTDIYTVTTDDDGVTVAVADKIAKSDMVYVAKDADGGKTAKIVFVFVDETTKN